MQTSRKYFVESNFLDFGKSPQFQIKKVSLMEVYFLLQVLLNVMHAILLPYSDKRKQLLKMTFLINEQNVSVMYIDINAISLCLDLDIFQQEECFCSKFGLKVEHAKSNLNASLSQIWVICHLLPFVRVGH